MERPCGPHPLPQLGGQLEPKEAHRIASLGLYLNQPESAIIRI
jgi:hypothetical protein